MTVAVFEGGAVEGAGTSAGSSRAAAARQSRPSPEQMGRGGPRGGQARVINARTVSTGSQGPRGPSGPQGAPGAQPAPKRAPQPKRPPQKRPEPKSRRKNWPPARSGRSGRGSGSPNYQAVIAVEYVGTTLLVAMSPIATRKAQASPTSGKLSPYVPGDLIKIWAIGITYLILELLAAGPRGLARFSAWFGFLIAIGVGLSELSHIVDIFKVISGAEINPVQLTGAQAPATKGGATIPPLVPGGQASAPPPPKGGGTGG